MEDIITDTIKIVHQTQICINSYTPKFQLDEIIPIEYKNKIILEWRKSMISSLSKMLSKYLDGLISIQDIHEYINKIDDKLFYYT